MDETKNEILTRVDALAEKLGTTAEYLWELLYAEIMLRGILLGCLGVLVLVVGLVCARRMIREGVRREDARAAASSYGERNSLPAGDGFLFGGGIIGVLAAIIGLVIACSYLSEALAPGREILKLLGAF